MPAVVLVALTLLLPAARCLNNGLARTPPMAFNTWNSFHLDINEDLIKQAADIIVSSGLLASGYNYLIMDDGWAERTRDGNNPIAYSADRFPGGISALADYVHAKGLKLGIYSDSGSKTCGGFTASLGYEKIDALQFAKWKIDLLKYDNCWSVPTSQITVQQRYTDMELALNATGRPILYQMCEWGVSQPWLYGPQIANTWRTSQDISIAVKATWSGILNNFDSTVGLARFAGPGGWNDPDMLELGYPNGEGLSFVEQRAHFALWAALKAPLVFGTDIRNMTNATLSILQSAEVIAVNQDPLGVPADLVWKEGPEEVYAGPLAGNARVALLFNRHDNTDKKFNTANMTVYWKSIGLPPDAPAVVRSLYDEQDLGTFTGSFSALIEAHGVGILKITPLTPANAPDNWRPYVCDPSIGYQCPLAAPTSPTPALRTAPAPLASGG